MYCIWWCTWPFEEISWMVLYCHVHFGSPSSCHYWMFVEAMAHPISINSVFVPANCPQLVEVESNFHHCYNHPNSFVYQSHKELKVSFGKWYKLLIVLIIGIVIKFPAELVGSGRDSKCYHGTRSTRHLHEERIGKMWGISSFVVFVSSRLLVDPLLLFSNPWSLVFINKLAS